MSLSYTSHQPSNPQTSSTLAILIHGGALSGRMYRTLVPHLTVPSIAIDLPGHGRSADLGPFSFQKSTDLIKSLIESVATLASASQASYKHIILIGISLGGQVVLDFLANYPGLISGAIVSGASIHPPDEHAAWEMPKMPDDKEWIDMMMEDVAILGMENASDIQQESLAFTFQGSVEGPPVLVCVGEHDVAMARRDFDELVRELQKMNGDSSGLIVDGAWHNHSIDIPVQFAAIVNDWIQTRFASEKAVGALAQ